MMQLHTKPDTRPTTAGVAVDLDIMTAATVNKADTNNKAMVRYVRLSSFIAYGF